MSTNQPPEPTTKIDHLIRAATLIFSFLCLAFAQLLVSRPVPVISSLRWAEWLNQTFHLRLSNTNNVMLGGLFLLIGAVIFLWHVPTNGRFTSSSDTPSSASWPPTNLLPLRSTLIRIGAALFLFVVMLLGIGTGRSESWLAVFGLAALTLISTVLWRWERAAEKPLAIPFTRHDALWIITLFTVGLLINSAYLAQLPARLVGDEGTFWEVAHDIAQGGYSPSPFGLGVYTFPIASSIYQGWVMRLFGQDLWGWRFSSVLVSLLTTPFLFLFLREWLSRRVAAVGCLIMLTMPFFLAFARLGYNNSQAMLPVMVTIWLWYTAVKRHSYFYGWLAGITAGLGFYTYSAGQMGIVLIMLLGTYFWYRKQLTLNGLLTLTLIALIGWQMTNMPLSTYSRTLPEEVQNSYKLWESSMANAFYGRDFFTDAELFSSYSPIRQGQNELFIQPRIYGIFLVRGIFRTLLVFHNGFLGTEEHFIETGLAGPGLIALLYGLGLLYALKHWREPLFGITLIWWGATMLLLSATNTFPPRHTHIVNLIPAVAIFILTGLYLVADTAAGWWQQQETLAKRPRLQTTLWLGGLVAVLAINANGYFAPVLHRYPDSLEQAMTFAALRAPDNTLLVTVDETDTHHDLAYQTEVGLVPNPYLPLTYNDIINSDLGWGLATPVLLFYPTGTDEAILASVNEALGRVQTAVPFINRNGITMGFALTNLQFNLQPTFSIIGGVRSVISSPAGPLLLLLLLTATAVFLFTWQDGSLRLAPLYTRAASGKRLITASLRIDPSAGQHPDTAGREQFEISLRIGWRKPDRPKEE